MQSPRANITLIIACLLSVLCFWQTAMLYQKGVQGGMDKVLPEAIEDNTWSIAVAISDMVYGLHKGYLYNVPVFDTLNEYGMTKYTQHLENLFITYPDNLKNPELLNTAIAEAMKVKLPPVRSLKNGLLRALPATDLGQVDYFKLSFALFGFTVDSAYKLYFVLFTIGLAAFLLEFRTRPIYYALPLAYMVLIQCYMDFILGIDDMNYASIMNCRSLSSLAIIPFFHIMFLTFESAAFTRSRFILICMQSMMFVFIMSVRSSVMWMLMALLSIAVFYLLYAWCKGNLSRHVIRQNWPLLTTALLLATLNMACKLYYSLLNHIANISNFHDQIPILIGYAPQLLIIAAAWLYVVKCLYKRHALSLKNIPIIIRPYFTMYGALFKACVINNSRWALLVLLGTVLSYNTFMTYKTHPVYYTEHALPHHMRWHNAVIGLAVHPDFKKRFESELRGGLDNNYAGDGLAFNLAFKTAHDEYAAKGKEFPVGQFISGYTGTIKTRLSDAYAAKALFKFIAMDPLFFLETLQYKFVYMNELWDKHIGMHPLFHMLLAYSIGLALFSLLALRRGWVEQRHVCYLVIGGILAGIYSYIPVLHAYHHMISIESLSMISVLVLSLPLAAALLLHRAIDAVIARRSPALQA